MKEYHNHIRKITENCGKCLNVEPHNGIKELSRHVWFILIVLKILCKFIYLFIFLFCSLSIPLFFKPADENDYQQIYILDCM